jgi:hypothetical protein
MKIIVGVKIPLKKIIIAISLVIGMMITLQIPSNAENTSKPPEHSSEELYHDIVLLFLGPYTDKAVTDYYLTILNENPHVYPYQVDVVKAERIGEYRSFHFLVTLEVTPVVGPHISVGKDRLTFEITPTITPSQVKLIKFDT